MWTRKPAKELEVGGLRGEWVHRRTNSWLDSWLSLCIGGRVSVWLQIRILKRWFCVWMGAKDCLLGGGCVAGWISNRIWWHRCQNVGLCCRLLCHVECPVRMAAQLSSHHTVPAEGASDNNNFLHNNNLIHDTRSSPITSPDPSTKAATDHG
jgi:hypothetical protein